MDSNLGVILQNIFFFIIFYLLLSIAGIFLLCIHIVNFGINFLATKEKTVQYAKIFFYLIQFKTHSLQQQKQRATETKNKITDCRKIA